MNELAKAAKRTSDMIGKHNDIVAFSRPEIADRPEVEEVSDALARASLASELITEHGDDIDTDNCGKAGSDMNDGAQHLKSHVKFTSSRNGTVRWKGLR